MMRPRRLRRRSIVPLVVALAIGAACGSSSHRSTVTPGASASSSPAPTAASTADRRAIAVRSALFSDGDLPTDIHATEGSPAALAPGDVPGLVAPATSVSVMIASQDQNEFVTVAAVLPSDGNAAALLTAFTLDNYLKELTGNAADAQGATIAPDEHAPAGARAFSYSGTLAGAQPHHVQGAAIAFRHGTVFIVIVHGIYAPSSRAVDLARLASVIDARLPSDSAAP